MRSSLVPDWQMTPIMETYAVEGDSAVLPVARSPAQERFAVGLQRYLVDMEAIATSKTSLKQLILNTKKANIWFLQAVNQLPPQDGHIAQLLIRIQSVQRRFFQECIDLQAKSSKQSSSALRLVEKVCGLTLNPE